MALASNALTTFATVKSEVGLATGDQSAAERLINVASEAIERHCGRRFSKTTWTSDRYRPTGGHYLWLRQSPIVSIASIYSGDTLVDSATYRIEDAQVGSVWLDDAIPSADYPPFGSVGQDGVPQTGEKTIIVTYVAGYILPWDTGAPNTPSDLEQACIETVASMWRQRGVDRNSAAYGANYIIPTAVLGILDRYRRWSDQ